VDEVDEVLDLTEESIENVSSFSNDVSMTIYTESAK